MTRLSFATDSTSTFVPVGLELIGRFCGIEFESTRRDESPHTHVYYGNDEQRPCDLRIPVVSSYDDVTVPGLPQAWHFPASGNSNKCFPFDLFTALRFWLADEGNANAASLGHLDVHGRLLPNCSIQHKKGVRDVPIVNAYISLLSAWIQQCCQCECVSPLPPGKRCVVVLSHDVDDPEDSGFRKDISLAIRSKSIRVLAKTAGLACKGRYLAERQRQGRHWLFNEIMAAEQAHGFRSTFFFAVTPWYRGSHYDVPYDVYRKRYKRLVRAIIAGGWDIGLHASYNAHRTHQDLAQEAKSLERVVGARIRGNRCHYWRMSWPFWKGLTNLESAGFRWDSSVAFNEMTGYRLGIAFPCHLWNPLTERRISTMQIPCAVMDGAYFYHPGQTVDRTLAHFDALLQNLKRYQGVAAIDWHVRSSFPISPKFRLWGEAYLEVLRMLAADSEVSVQSFSQLVHSKLLSEFDFHTGVSAPPLAKPIRVVDG